MTLRVLGIKNCNTMKKAFEWFDRHHIAYDFHDYKKSGADENVLKAAFSEYGWEQVINRKGMTWRNLSGDIKENMDEDEAFKQAVINPSLIKRPIIVTDSDHILIGFSEDNYEQEFKQAA